MITQMSQAQTRQQRRSRAVYRTLRHGPSPMRLLAAEIVLLSVIVVGIAGFIGLRAWFALAQ